MGAANLVACADIGGGRGEVSRGRYWIIAAIIAVGAAYGWLFLQKAESQAVEEHPREREISQGDLALVGGGQGSSSEIFDSGSELSPTTYSNRIAASGVNLRFEKTLLRGGRISYDQTIRILQGDHFDSYMQDVLWQSARDLDAAHLTELYARKFETAFTNDPSIFIEDFACGLSICVGEITTYGVQGEQEYSRFHKALSLADDTPAYSMIELPIGEDRDVTEHRFVFATDPFMNGIGDRAVY